MAGSVGTQRFARHGVDAHCQCRRHTERGTQRAEHNRAPLAGGEVDEIARSVSGASGSRHQRRGHDALAALPGRRLVTHVGEPAAVAYAPGRANRSGGGCHGWCRHGGGRIGRRKSIPLRLCDERGRRRGVRETGSAGDRVDTGADADRDRQRQTGDQCSSGGASEGALHCFGASPFRESATGVAVYITKGHRRHSLRGRSTTQLVAVTLGTSPPHRPRCVHSARTHGAHDGARKGTSDQGRPPCITPPNPGLP